jgi:hypothetical protein
MKGMVIAIPKAIRAFFIPFYRNFPPSRFSGEKRSQASGRMSTSPSSRMGHALRSLLELELFASVFGVPAWEFLFLTPEF